MNKLKWFIVAIRVLVHTRSLEKARQVWHMGVMWVNSNVRLVEASRNRLVWTMDLRPHMEHDEKVPTYTIKLVYGLEPRVYVLSHDIRQDTPYQLSDGALGLYHPEDGFHPCLPLAKTIVPWTVLWLYTYRIWDVTGEWFYHGSNLD